MKEGDRITLNYGVTNRHVLPDERDEQGFYVILQFGPFEHAEDAVAASDVLASGVAAHVTKLSGEKPTRRGVQ